MAHDFDPVIPYEGEFPPIAPTGSDPRQTFAVAEGSIEDRHLALRSLTPQKAALIGTKVYRSSTQATAHDTAEFMEWDTEVWDEGDCWSSADTDAVYLPFAGIWAIYCLVEFAANGTGQRKVTVYQNATEKIANAPNALTGRATRIPLSLMVRAAAGDTIQVEVYQDSTGNLNVNSGEANNFLAVDYRGPI